MAGAALFFEALPKPLFFWFVTFERASKKNLSFS
jgi:hypothetical protein